MPAQSMTILQVLPALESGGVERGTLEVAEALVRQGHRSLVMSAGGRLVQPLLAQGSEHFTWQIGKKSLATLLLVGRLRRFLLQHRVDVVHVRSRLPAWIVYLAWRRIPSARRPRLVTTVHGFYSVSRYSAVMTRGEKVIAVSQSVRQYILDNYPGVDAQRIEVIPRGLQRRDYPYGFHPEPAWLAQWYADYPMLKGKQVLTLPGRVTRLKGHEDFIEVIDCLHRDGYEVAAVIAGGAAPGKQEYLDELQRLVSNRGLADSVVFTGQRSDLREVMAAGDIVFSLTQKPESFGRTTLEALSMGIPVCGYAHGGVAEQLEDLLPAGLVPVKDVHKACETVREWLDEPPRVKPTHNYLLETMVARTLQVYAELVAS